MLTAGALAQPQDARSPWQQSAAIFSISTFTCLVHLPILYVYMLIHLPLRLAPLERLPALLPPCAAP